MSILTCAKCRNEHHQAQHRLTESGTRSPTCIFCEGTPLHSVDVDEIIPPVNTLGSVPQTGIWKRFLGLAKGTK